MTTTARTDANRQNAALSTGPRTPEGKLVVARNAVRHGVFAAVPVLPTEEVSEWEAHRAGVVDGLGARGAVEVALAERAALLLWRMGRLARYEAAVTAARLEDVDLPPIPARLTWPPPAVDNPEDPRAMADRLAELRRELAAGEAALAARKAAYALVADPTGHPDDLAVPPGVAADVLFPAYAEAEGRRRKTPVPDSPEFLRGQLGLDADAAHDADWTAGLVRRGLAYYAGRLGWDTPRLTAAVRAGLDLAVADGKRAVDRLHAEAAALDARLARGTDWRRARRSVLPDDYLERVMRYEGHLGRQLQMALDQLRLVQAARAGTASPPVSGILTVSVEGP